MAKSASHQERLRLYTEQLPKPAPTSLDTIACFAELRRAFENATGWSLQSRPKRPSARPTYGAADGRCALSVEPTKNTPALESLTGDDAAADKAETWSGIDRGDAQSLARSIATLLDELLAARRALWQREAELAANVPLVPQREPQGHLAASLEAVLRAGVEAVGCQSTALYLLDEATTELKMRSSWGLPFDRLTAPARPLRGAMADLEALLGHAVVLNDKNLLEVWNAPENYPTAVCVPVSTPTTLLGTLWVFCDENRDFNDRETNLLEVIAGRLAADLEREMLMRLGVETARLQRQVASAERLQRNRLPTIAPMLDGWEVAGLTAQSGNLGGAFHDWFCLPKGLLAVAIGRAADQGIVGAINADAAMSAMRSHAQHRTQPERILHDVNMTLWTGSAGDRHVTGLLGLIDPANGRLRCSSAGRPSILWLRADGWQSLSHDALKLGESPETAFQQFTCELRPGEALVLCSHGAHDKVAAEDLRQLEARLADLLLSKLDLTADGLLATAAPTLVGGHSEQDVHDHAILIVKRTPA